MQPSSNPNSIEKLRGYPRFPKCEESMENAIDSCPRYVQNKNINLGAIFPQQKLNSPILAPSENSRAALNLDKAVEYELKHGRRLDPNMDKKKLRRIVSNRLSAHRARLRKAKYINELENMANNLEDMISVLASRIESYKENQKLLLQQNESLQQLLLIRLDEANLSQSIQVEKNRKEVSRLKELAKIMSKGEHDSNGGGQGIHDLISKQLIAQHYATLSFYEEGLQKLGANHFRQERIPSSIRVQSGAKMARPSSSSKQPKNNQGEAEADQYLNLEE